MNSDGHPPIEAVLDAIDDLRAMTMAGFKAATNEIALPRCRPKLRVIQGGKED